MTDTLSENSPQETTDKFDRQALREGWAEMDRIPSIVAEIKFGAKTDLGRIRENNEDKFDFYEPEDPAVLASKGIFYAVADGMGGAAAGQIACELALKTVIQRYYASPSPDLETCLRRAIEEANALIYDTAQAIHERQGMGTTLTAVVIRDGQLTIAQVGDSRAYLIRNGQIVQLTDDHSWVAEQVRLGTMSLEDAQNSPFRNIITRSIGTAAMVEPDLQTLPLQADDLLVLCSDGLSGHLEAADIHEIAARYSPSVAAARLVEEANERGGRDNITTIVLSIRALRPYQAPETPPAREAAQTPPSLFTAEPAAAPKPARRFWGLRR